MKLLLVAISVIVGVSSGAKLTNNYLPPTFGGSSSAGHGGFLQTPLPSSQYIPSALPQSTPVVPILKFENTNKGDGNYNFEYQTANGISRQETGYVNNPGSEHAEQVVTGSYSYTGSDGVVYTVHYKADSSGFHATGAHLPTPPPIPGAIKNSLALHKRPSSTFQPQQQHIGGTASRPSSYLPPQNSGYGFNQVGGHF